jgi:hypothetical protein
MAYDPYDRGDNPWRTNLDTLDMPRSRPKAKPGAGRASSTAPVATKKKAKPKTAPMPPRRPGFGARDLTDAAQPSEGPFPPELGAMPSLPDAPEARSMPELLTPPPDVPGGLPLEAQGPAIPGGLLAGPTPGYRPPESARSMMGGIFDTGPIDPRAPAPAPIRGGPGTPFDTGPVTPMPMPDWLRRLFAGGGAPPTGGMPTGMP